MNIEERLTDVNSRLGDIEDIIDAAYLRSKEKEQKGDDTEFLREVYQLVIGDEHASRTDENKFSHEEVLSLISDYQQAYYAQELK